MLNFLLTTYSYLYPMPRRISEWEMFYILLKINIRSLARERVIIEELAKATGRDVNEITERLNSQSERSENEILSEFTVIFEDRLTDLLGDSGEQSLADKLKAAIDKINGDTMDMIVKDAEGD